MSDISLVETDQIDEKVQIILRQTDYTKEIIDNTIYDKKLAIIILHDDDVLIGNKKMFCFYFFFSTMLHI